MARKAAAPARNVLVTGGSRGLGLGIARKLAAAGYCVIAVARKPNKELLAAMAQAKRGKNGKSKSGGGALHFVAFDLGKIDEIPALVRELHKKFGPVFGLVNDAALGLDDELAVTDVEADGCVGLDGVGVLAGEGFQRGCGRRGWLGLRCGLGLGHRSEKENCKE